MVSLREELRSQAEQCNRYYSGQIHRLVRRASWRGWEGESACDVNDVLIRGETRRGSKTNARLGVVT